ncbi:hypothetical protein MUK42_30888 [Musa troglodytarum]|uniref:Uncharacterized protein n=1 Tax=Musa troglodytarum TaxID=320322 RepID=A0A9E7FK57_9LILI|nr:hypothetical protein MUK42_30888 [Musa troglodytarum]
MVREIHRRRGSLVHPDSQSRACGVHSATDGHDPSAEPVGPASRRASSAVKYLPNAFSVLPFSPPSLSARTLFGNHDAVPPRPRLRARRPGAVVGQQAGGGARTGRPHGRLPRGAATAPPHDLQPRVRTPLPHAKAAPPRGAPRPGEHAPVREPRPRGPARRPRPPPPPRPPGQPPPPRRGLRPLPASRRPPQPPLLLLPPRTGFSQRRVFSRVELKKA